VFFIPTLTAFTSSRLSLLVRPLTVGTVTGGSLAAESFPMRDAVLDEVFPLEIVAPATGAEAPFDGMLALAADPVRTAACEVEDAAVGESLGIDSPVGDGRASLLAAQASEATSAKDAITEIELDLLDKISDISIGLMSYGGRTSGGR
jgi:hypothetical protein